MNARFMTIDTDVWIEVVMMEGENGAGVKVVGTTIE